MAELDWTLREGVGKAVDVVEGKCYILHNWFTGQLHSGWIEHWRDLDWESPVHCIAYGAVGHTDCIDSG